MSPRSFRRPGLWIATVLSGLCMVTGISFIRAQQVGGSVPTFQPGGGVPVRGVPMNQRPFGVSFPGPNGSTLGPFPVPVAVMPNKPIAQKGFNQQPTNPNNFGINGSSNANTNSGTSGSSGSALGAGGISGGTSGTSTVGASGAGIAGGGVAGFGGMPAQGQNFQNPTGNLGFPQTPVNYFGGTTGGGITGAGIAGTGLNATGGVSGGNIQGGGTSISGGVGGAGGVGGFGSGGFGGGVKGIAGAGNNGI